MHRAEYSAAFDACFGTSKPSMRSAPVMSPGSIIIIIITIIIIIIIIVVTISSIIIISIIVTHYKYGRGSVRGIHTGVCKTSPPENVHIGALAFRAPNHRLEGSSCCWTAGQALA